MSLQFIIGGSGSGKTRTLYENLIRQSMEEPDGRFFALVPEQFTMQTQKEIVMLHPNHGVMNIDIVSFERLAYRVFEELAIENLAVLDDMGIPGVYRGKSDRKRRNFKPSLPGAAAVTAHPRQRCDAGWLYGLYADPV